MWEQRILGHEEERTMRQRQVSFADVAAEDRHRELKAKRGRHLAKIGELVPWEEFRPLLEEVWRTPRKERKSAAGRKPWTPWSCSK